MSDEGRTRDFDHFHRTAGVNLIAGQVGEVGENGSVHQTGSPPPIVLRRRIMESVALTGLKG